MLFISDVYQIQGLWFPSVRVYIFGNYESEPCGTDSYSHGCWPTILAWLSTPSIKQCCVIMEGDRVYQKTFLLQLYTITDGTLQILQMESAEPEKTKRKQLRGQNEQWLRSRETICTNILAIPQFDVTICYSTCEEDINHFVEYMKNILEINPS